VKEYYYLNTYNITKTGIGSTVGREGAIGTVKGKGIHITARRKKGSCLR
jgi:hypothetical protein